MTWLMIQLGLRVRWRLEKDDGDRKSVVTLTADKGAADATWEVVKRLVDDGWWIVKGPYSFGPHKGYI